MSCQRVSICDISRILQRENMRTRKGINIAYQLSTALQSSLHLSLFCKMKVLPRSGWPHPKPFKILKMPLRSKRSSNVHKSISSYSAVTPLDLRSIVAENGGKFLRSFIAFHSLHC